MLKARTRAVLEKRVLALAHHEELLKQVQGIAGRTRAREGAEIAPLTAPRSAMKRKPRELLLGREVDIWEALVVPQHDVVAGTVLLDEVVLEQQRFGLGVGGRDLHRYRVLHERPRLRRQLVGRAEVARHAFLEIARLAHVEHLTAGIEHAVDAGLAGQGAEEGSRIEFSECFFHDRRGRAPRIIPVLSGSWRGSGRGA